MTKQMEGTKTLMILLVMLSIQNKTLEENYELTELCMSRL